MTDLHWHWHWLILKLSWTLFKITTKMRFIYWWKRLNFRVLIPGKEVTLGPGFMSWVQEQDWVDGINFTMGQLPQHSHLDFMFKNKKDAIMFKLAWGGR